jgi:hypothetical protein
MNLSPAELAVFGTLGGAFVAGLFGAIIAFINKRSEEKKHLRELIVKTSTEHWQFVVETAESNIMPPLINYIVHTAMMCDLILNKKLSSKNIQNKLKEIDSLMDVLHHHAIEVSKKRT